MTTTKKFKKINSRKKLRQECSDLLTELQLTNLQYGKLAESYNDLEHRYVELLNQKKKFDQELEYTNSKLKDSIQHNDRLECAIKHLKENNDSAHEVQINEMFNRFEDRLSASIRQNSDMQSRLYESQKARDGQFMMLQAKEKTIQDLEHDKRRLTLEVQDLTVKLHGAWDKMEEIEKERDRLREDAEKVVPIPVAPVAPANPNPITLLDPSYPTCHEVRTNRQKEVAKWYVENSTAPSTSHELSMRFLEDALEVVKANLLSKSDVTKMTKYVYEKPHGSLAEEIGSASLGLSLLAEAAGYNIEERELSAYCSLPHMDKEYLKTAQADRVEAGVSRGQ